MSVIENIMNIPAEHEKNVFGSFDGNIKKIERTLHVTVIARDSQVKIIGVMLQQKEPEVFLSS